MADLQSEQKVCRPLHSLRPPPAFLSNVLNISSLVLRSVYVPRRGRRGGGRGKAQLQVHGRREASEAGGGEGGRPFSLSRAFSPSAFPAETRMDCSEVTFAFL